MTTADACKPEVLAQGIVMLLPDGSDWLSDLPPVTIVNGQGRPMQLQGGFLRDPQLATLARKFCDAVAADTFLPQPLRI